MLTVLFASFGSFIEEVSGSIIKFETDHQKESIYTAAFINFLFGLLVFVILAVVRGSFVFQLASLTVFIPRILLEIVQTWATLTAIMKSDRSTYAFVRNLTIPLLIIVDLLLGFQIGFYQWIGIAIILITLVIILVFHVIETRGIGWSLFASINAIATITLFKYNITHFNSVEGEQIVSYAILLTYFFLMAKFKRHENPLQFLKQKVFLGQGITHGVSSILESFALFLGNPGIAIAAKRASGVLAGIISGRHYFAESKFLLKVAMACLLIVGLVFLI